MADACLVSQLGRTGKLKMWKSKEMMVNLKGCDVSTQWRLTNKWSVQLFTQPQPSLSILTTRWEPERVGLSWHRLCQRDKTASKAELRPIPDSVTSPTSMTNHATKNNSSTSTINNWLTLPLKPTTAPGALRAQKPARLYKYKELIWLREF